MNTLAEQLAEVETAITAALAAQSITQGDGSQHVRPDVEGLMRERRRLRGEIEWASKGNRRVVEFL